MKVRAPHGSCFSVLEEIDAGRLVLRRTAARISAALSTRHRGRQELLALADVAHEDRLADQAQVEQRLVALHLAIERRLAVGEDDLEAELRGEERARRLDVGDEEFGFDGGQRPASRRPVGLVSVMACTPVLSACQLSNPDWRATSSWASLSLNAPSQDLAVASGP